MRSAAATSAERVGVLVMSHGTPRSLDELVTFYTAIRRGRTPTPELLADLERRYLAIGGTSPLTERTSAQVAGIARCLDELAPGRFVVGSGAKFASPLIEDAVGTLVRAGVRRAVGIVLAPHSSQASVGDYRRRALAAARSSALAGGGPLEMHVVDHWYAAAGFDELLAERVVEAIKKLSATSGSDAPTGSDAPGGSGAPCRSGTPGETIEVLFTAHSVPARLAGEGDRYEEQVGESAKAVAAAAGIGRWRVAWQSAGLTDEPWLGPDVREVIGALGGSDTTGIVLCPIGFVSDHLEILYDLDIEAARAARRAGIALVRTESLNDDPRFCKILARVVVSAARELAEHES